MFSRNFDDDIFYDIKVTAKIFYLIIDLIIDIEADMLGCLSAHFPMYYNGILSNFMG